MLLLFIDFGQMEFCSSRARNPIILPTLYYYVVRHGGWYDPRFSRHAHIHQTAYNVQSQSHTHSFIRSLGFIHSISFIHSLNFPYTGGSRHDRSNGCLCQADLRNDRRFINFKDEITSSQSRSLLIFMGLTMSRRRIIK